MFYSKYKKRYTYKFLVGVSASGAIIFFSEAYPGRITDFELTKESGLIGFLERGDLVLADRGFLIQSLLTPKTRGEPLIVAKKELWENVEQWFQGFLELW